MRYKPEYKAEARARLLDAAGALAKAKGFGTTGVDQFMAAAGLTSGAFYSHFASKAELLKAIVEREVERTLKLYTGKDRLSLRKMLRFYLGAGHVDHPESGCPLPALSAEVARADTDSRQAYEKLIVQVKDALALHTQDESAAWAMLSQTVGAVMIARAMNPGAARDELLQAAQKQVDALLAER